MNIELKLLRGPEVVYPMNAVGGLYMELLRPDNVAVARYVPALKELARKHGYNPDGRASVGPPCQHGIDTVTHAVWFYEKVEP